MRRALLICLLLLLGLPAGAAAARVELTGCVTALAAEERAATFEARVRRTRGSERMQVSFRLQVRDATLPGWRRVVAARPDEWLTSDKGVRRYLYARTVENLSAPAAYRMVARFRWLDPDGAVLARTRATSRVCRQPDLRPNLTVTGIAFVAPLYTVTLHNNGRSAPGPFSVVLRAGELELERVAVPDLAAGERRTLTFSGPACAAGSLLTATLDPDLAVDERNEYDNVLAAPC